MPRSFNAAELDEMQVDWQRTHNVKDRGRAARLYTAGGRAGTGP